MFPVMGSSSTGVSEILPFSIEFPGCIRHIIMAIAYYFQLFPMLRDKAFLYQRIIHISLFIYLQCTQLAQQC